MIRVLVFTLCIVVPTSIARAQECREGAQCVAAVDLQTFVQLARDHSCRAHTTPALRADDMTIVLDRQGRVFGSGTGSKPFTAELSWCNYRLQVSSQLHLVAAQYVEPEWGFRLRFKATVGVLLRGLFGEAKLYDAIDAGIAVEGFYFRFVNANVIVGVRAAGLGIGTDITENFGLLFAINVAYESWRIGPSLGLSFAF